MKKVMIALGLLALAGGAVQTAKAGDHRAVRGHVVYRANHNYYAPAPVVYRPAPVYYAPAPVVYRPAPVVYRPAPVYCAPAPVVYQQPVVCAPAVVVRPPVIALPLPPLPVINFGFGIRLGGHF